MKSFFTDQGVCLIGTMKGLHASKLREGWVKWASKDIQGFEAQYKTALQQKTKPKPTGRTYILKPWKKMNTR